MPAVAAAMLAMWCMVDGVASSGDAAKTLPAVTFLHGDAAKLIRVGGAAVGLDARVPTDAVLHSGRQYVGGQQHWSDPIVRT